MTDLNDTWSLSQIRCWGPGRWGPLAGAQRPTWYPAMAPGCARSPVVAASWPVPSRFGGRLPCDWEIGEAGQPGTAGRPTISSVLAGLGRQVDPWPSQSSPDTGGDPGTRAVESAVDAGCRHRWLRTDPLNLIWIVLAKGRQPMPILPDLQTPPFRPAHLAEQLQAMRERSPLVQCLTNAVVSQWTANVLLAVGAVPAMVDNPAEAGDFAMIAGAVLINLGTPQKETVAAMRGAVAGAAAADTPWVLDPVAVGPLAWRTRIARDLLADASPAIVRGNASEILALAGDGGGRGPESVDDPASALAAAGQLARDLHTVVAVSGEVDHLTDGRRVVRVANGHPWLTKVTGGGCALGAVLGAYAAVAADPLLAATAATAAYTVAAERAAAEASGPGSFAVALLDALAGLTAEELAARVRLS